MDGVCNVIAIRSGCVAYVDHGSVSSLAFCSAFFLYKNTVYLSSALGVLLAFGLIVTCLFITKYTGGYAVVLGSGALCFWAIRCDLCRRHSDR